MKALQLEKAILVLTLLPEVAILILMPLLEEATLILILLLEGAILAPLPLPALVKLILLLAVRVTKRMASLVEILIRREGMYIVGSDLPT